MSATSWIRQDLDAGSLKISADRAQVDQTLWRLFAVTSVCENQFLSQCAQCLVAALYLLRTLCTLSPGTLRVIRSHLSKATRTNYS